MANTSFNYKVGLQKCRPQNYLQLIFADKLSRQYIWFTCNRAQKYSERYLLRKFVFRKTLSLCLVNSQYQITPANPYWGQRLPILEIFVESWIAKLFTGDHFRFSPIAVKSKQDFVHVLCSQFMTYLPILMETNRNHQKSLNKGFVGFSSLDISDYDGPKYQIKNCQIGFFDPCR